MCNYQENTSENLASMLNDCSIDRIMAIDTDWHILVWNKTAEQVTGIKKEEVLHQNLLQVFPGIAIDKEMRTAIELAFSGFKSFVAAHKSYDHRCFYENHFIPLKDKNGKVFGVMNIMHDVSHRIKAEQQLHHLNIELEKKYRQLEMANDELATIIHITSNNFKEPLRHVYSSLEILVRAEGKVLSDGGKANLRRMQASLNRMNLLLDDILTLSGIKNAQDTRVQVDLNIVLKEASRQLADKLRGNNASIKAQELPVVTGHSDMIQYVFFHLFCNALKCSRQNQPLHINIESSQVILQDSSEHAANKTYMRLSFIDDGIGFPQEDSERIFSIIDQASQKYTGSSAVLAICRKIMLAHEGFIQAEGWPDKGAAYHCFFPHIGKK